MEAIHDLSNPPTIPCLAQSSPFLRSMADEMEEFDLEEEEMSAGGEDEEEYEDEFETDEGEEGEETGEGNACH